MTHHGYWTSEHDWEVSLDSAAQMRENVLCVLFDNGAQRQFSRVRITLLCSSEITPKQRQAWKIRHYVSPLVANRFLFDSKDKPAPQNDSSLPVCDIVFVAGQHSARSRTISRVAGVCGELVLAEARSLEVPDTTTIFEFDQSLTENTQSVSVSFTSSRLLCTTITRGVFSEPSADHSSTVCRVVRVLPVDAMSKRITISLPADVLLLIFESLRFPPSYHRWRKDILYSALVCREWTCALSLLLVDFRSEKDQWGHPPEISSLAHALDRSRSLSLCIKYLSVDYLQKHPNWNACPDTSMGHPTPMLLAMLRLQQSNPRRLEFDQALLAILGIARNVQTLYFNQSRNLVLEHNSLADALHGLDKLEIFKGWHTLTMAQLVSCVATWPSLKHLSILNVLPPVDPIYPFPSPTCSLTVLELSTVPVKDGELMCIVSASGSTLERLTLNRISKLTNAGLGAVLNTVCRPLSYLAITGGVLQRDRDEEHALDTTIVRMKHLMTLRISPTVASERMLERRAEAFRQRTTPGLSEVQLYLIGAENEDGGLITAASRVWPGWKEILQQ